MTHGGTLFAAYWAQHQELLPPDDEVWYWAPEQVTLYSQTGVVSHTFLNGKGVVKFNAPVTTMGQTLRGTPVVRVSLPQAVMTIEELAFYGCTELTSINTERITTFAAHCFTNCTSLASVVLNPSLSAISAGLFSGCSALVLSSIPDSVTTINGDAFRSCTSITLSKLPDSLVSIGLRAFLGCSNVSFSVIPAGVDTIDNAMIASAPLVTSLRFLGKPTSIGTDALYYQRNYLTDIYVPWSEGEVANVPWGATNATIHYNYTA